MSDSRISLNTVLAKALDFALSDLHTCLPAVVTKVDHTTQLIDCQATIKKKLNGSVENLALLTNVPFRCFKVRDFSITFPVKAGDEVLVLFAERSIDTWITMGGIQDPLDFRKHSLSDGFAFPCMYSQKELIPTFSSENLEIKTNSGNLKIIVKSSGELEIITSGKSIVTSGGGTEINNDVLINGELTVTNKATLQNDLEVAQAITAGSFVGAPSLVGNGLEMTTHVHLQDPPNKQTDQPKAP